ncbi:2,4-dienoyl-CoA reductase [Halovenus aranensis]|uniref:2,4-dienoyl-CoA reductase n=1 Tax=Halovenus aranensis TaxID=890420 RepID=A0A1G8VM78_9EURY|nr:NADH:flavin oxidoreductase/NADH oxidase [Halovenus aranensis]SDJ67141.1 2,4-dienoyl-CoA reductase [Halovenus aranensis]
MSHLFTEFSLGETTVPNRLMVSPMCQYSCDDRDGHATDWHQVHLGSRAVGGAGIVMTEATAVEARGRISPEDLGIWDDDHVDSLRRVTRFISSQGSIPAIQLAHAGWKGSTVRPRDGHDTIPADEDGGWTVVGPTADSFPYDRPEPALERLDSDGLDEVIDAFGRAAERAVEAGFEIVEIHAAHGYLLHQFLSPVTNTREDDYGGDFEGRTRLTREVTAAVRERVPESVPVFVRISATDWLPEPSWTVEQSVRLTDRLAELGVDLVDVSSGGINPDSYPDYQGPNYQLPLAERLKDETETEVAVGAVGKITTPEQAEAVVANDRADLVIVGREHLQDPYFGLRAAAELGAEEVTGPPQYRGLVQE